MKIHLPNSAFLGNIEPFIKSFDPAEPEELFLTANKRWVSVHPVVLCMIAALGIQKNVTHVNCEPLEAKSKHYLERMGLFRFLGIDAGIKITEHESAGRFVPLTQIRDSQMLSVFLQEMTPLLHLKPKQAETVKYAISELVRNVLEHSLSPTGAIISAQYHQKSNILRMGVVDAGEGIWKSIHNSWNPKNDLEALQLALTPGITGTTRRIGGTDYNAGAGLFFIKSIAYVNKNFFMVYSGNAMYKLLKRGTKNLRLHADPFKYRHTQHDDLPFWKGTVVGVDINLDNTKEFSALLDLINATYSQAIKERKKANYHKPIFI